MKYLLSFVIVLNAAHLGFLEPHCTPQFKCNTKFPRKYNVRGVTLNCPVNFVCNKDYIPTSCKPCVAVSAKTCGFKCLTSNRGELYTKSKSIAVTRFTCPKGKECNSKYKGSCAPCIDIVCRKQWTCKPKNPFEVTSGGLNFQCKGGKVCNKHYKYPCDACIFDNTVKPIKPPTHRPPSQYPPNCNDGYGSVNPCRPGPRGSNYYYKCKAVSSSSLYDFDVKMCSNLPLDSCRKYSYICK